jgi:copper oxidase (laccase) domain-containing protein
MILPDQPTIFGDALIVGVSSLDDGDISFGHGENEKTVIENRQQFLGQLGIDMIQTTQVKVIYADTTDFTRYHVIDDDRQSDGMLQASSDLASDALIVTRPDHALFLPLADCVGAVIYDPTNLILMVSHLGRHNVEANGAARSIEYLQEGFGSDPADLLVWLSPAAGATNYPLHAMNNRGLHEVIFSELAKSGVRHDHIEVSAVDTTESDEYFSHSQYLAGERSDDGRFAIVAMMRD